VAHRVDRWTCDQQVVGSNPTWGKSFVTTLGKLFTPMCLCHQATGSVLILQNEAWDIRTLFNIPSVEAVMMMVDWAVDTTDLVTNVFGGVKGDQFAKRRCCHMWRKWSRRLSVSRLLYVAISSPAVCWLGRIRTVAPRFYTVRATMTCPGLMIPSHVGLCYMPLDCL